MSKEVRKLEKFYELIPLDETLRPLGTVISKKRILIGRSDNCDLIIKDIAVSAIHAVLEVSGNRFRIFDMNSSNGTFINGERILAKEFKLGDKVRFANVDFVFNEYNQKDLLPPILDSLNPDHLGTVERQSTVKTLPKPPAPEKRSDSAPSQSKSQTYDLSQDIVSESAESGQEGSYVSYPLAKDPKADYSEYIFEDAQEIYPIFKWDVDKVAVEIVIIHQDRIFSVDYLPEKNGIYDLVGFSDDESDIEFPYLGKSERMPIVEIKNKQVSVKNTYGYEAILINDDFDSDFKPTTSPVLHLKEDDIVRLSVGDIQIYIRSTQAPPKVKHAPLLRRDDEFKKFLILFFVLVSSFLGIFSAIDVDKKKEEEKEPERIAKILYRKKYLAPKPKIAQKKPEPIKKAEPKPVQEPVKKPSVKPVEMKKPEPKKAETPKVAKKRPVQKVDTPKKGTTKAPGKAQKSVRKSVGGNSARPAQRAKAQANAKGRVESYKQNFGGALSQLLAKGGSVSGVAGADVGVGDLGVTERAIGGNEQGVQRADVAGTVGDLEGAASGKLNVSQGAEGLASKRTVMSAGIPSTTVVTGDYDASIVTQILRENLEQFRYCYQKELDTRTSAVNGLIRLNFTIGASGHVSQAGASGQIPPSVQKCVVNVLKGIRFPAPLGGGVVAIRQPMNFYAQRK